MAKAETGVGGAVVAEVAYRNEYVATRGQARLAEEAWQKNRCRETIPGSAMPVAPSSAPAALPTRAGWAGRGLSAAGARQPLCFATHGSGGGA